MENPYYEIISLIRQQSRGTEGLFTAVMSKCDDDGKNPEFQAGDIKLESPLAIQGVEIGEAYLGSYYLCTAIDSGYLIISRLSSV